ncbi:hypothetical protein GLOIN_2v1716860 [Rhizophagus irregularis DAOM 181602=DAOM 197198]|uniref:Uncharacterized protein n=1 Tax=Rhizophagus irregularis (strain DAOM 181602 / DAOM 197198 / MUCL 43194) TaxID=747089 RepID=A0A2P4P3T0_RHIID|nr:hypothetical protein GLOIN_2v1716860 [Rhizophagus irregularis DAOM 181602=DAOM 197198]POG60038.1 hypothetical protein GLOIN_2v1716860 [Rhizophagus irregularis DAOM 181602=DAOM 197198]|eukprot:XP_025166904.1 hypothetical protein GLOIN_2v1716860 [Rhizophagus irregularis DAOM 181602=DAOM 197198]
MITSSSINVYLFIISILTPFSPFLFAIKVLSSSQYVLLFIYFFICLSYFVSY